MEYINHYTLNTGNNVPFKREVIMNEAFFRIKGILRKLRTEKYVHIIDNVYIELTIEKGRYIATLFAQYEEEMIPILVTAGCDQKDLYADSVKMLVDIYEQLYKQKVKTVPMLPYVCDIVLPTLTPSEWINFTWTGEFCKLLAIELLK